MECRMRKIWHTIKNASRWRWFAWGAWFVFFIVGGVFVLCPYSYVFFEKDNLEAIRNIVLIMAALLAFPLALERMIIADKQLKATEAQLQQEQEKIATEKNKNKQLMKENEKRDRDREFEKWETNFLSSDREPRKEIIEKLWQFAQNHPEDYHVTVMKFFCDFIRDYSDINFHRPSRVVLSTIAIKNCEEHAHADVFRNARIDSINKNYFVSILSKVINREKAKTPRQQEVEKEKGYRIDLSDTNFESVDLSDGDLTNADLRCTFWKSTNVRNMKWTKAYIENALFMTSEDKTENFNETKGNPMPNQKIYIGDTVSEHSTFAGGEGARILGTLFIEQFKPQIIPTREDYWALNFRRAFPRPLPPLPKPK